MGVRDALEDALFHGVCTRATANAWRRRAVAERTWDGSQEPAYHGRMRVLSLALVASVACATAPTLRPVPPDGGGWRELRSHHFVLRTDLSAGRARGLLAELEAVVAGLQVGLFARQPQTSSLAVDVIAFESERDAELFLPAGADAIMSADPRWSRLTIVMTGSFGELQRAVVAHELTHVLMAASHARQPLWFKEGVACYAESIRWEGPKGNVVLGAVPVWRRWSAHPPRAGDLRDLLLARERLRADQYALAWGLVHYLAHQHPATFAVLQERFARGEEPLQAWRRIYPAWDPGEAAAIQRLRDEVWSYLSAEMHYFRLSARKPEVAPPSVERPLSAGEVHDVRLGLQWLNRGRPLPHEMFAAELAAGLASGSVAAAWIHGQDNLAQRRAVAERVTRGHPSDARAWLLLAAAAEPTDAREALLRAVDVEPSSAAARSALARHLLGRGDALEALPHANEAARLAPWSPSALETLAAVAQALGRCPEALRLQRRAIENAGERAPPRLLEQYLDRLARLERACGAEGSRPVAH